MTNDAKATAKLFPFELPQSLREIRVLNILSVKEEKRRIKLEDLSERDPATEAALQEALKRLGGMEGAPCRATCDCMIGLVCRESVCTPDW
jgi:hypothetical protein